MKDRLLFSRTYCLSYFLILLLVLQFSGCAAQRAFRKAQDAARRGEWDRAVGHYVVALNKKPDNPQYRAGFERARLAASQFHFQKAKQLMETKNYEQAIIEYQIAQNFDPANQFIANELENARKLYQKELNKDQLTAIEKAKQEAKKRMPINVVLGEEAEKTIQSLRFRDDSLKHILDSLGTVAGINIVYDSDFRDQEFSVSLDNIKFRDALNQILVANRLYYKPLDQSTILIIPDNPQKRRQYDEQVIQTFYLSNAELNDVLNMVRSVMQIQRIATNPQLNAITVRDTPDKVAIVQKIIEANDKSRSEVLLNVEILEIDRDEALRYGVDLSTYTVGQSLVINGGENAAGQFFGHQIQGIDAASWSFTVPSIIYQALSSDQRTKILAKPQIRASEGQQVTVRLGDRVPIPVTVFQSQAVGQQPGITVPTTTFQLTDVGINIDVTPRVHHNREITLTMRFELTSITAPGVGNTPPTLGNRTVNTVIRLKDGETNLLAGLLRRDERRSLRGVPGVIKIPFIRDIFAANDKSLQEKDVVFTITPHILRTPNVTEDDLAPIWIGTEDDIRLKTAPPISVFGEREEAQEPWELELPGDEETLMEGQGAPSLEPLEGQPPIEEGVDEKTGVEVAPPAAEPVPPAEKSAPGTPPATEPVFPETQPQREAPSEVEPATPPGEQPRPAVVPPVTPQPPPAEEEQVLEEPEVEEEKEEEPPVPTPPTATISFTTPNVNPTAGSDIVIHMQLENAQKAGSMALFLRFDPSVLQVKDVLQGGFVTPGAFSKSFDNARGTINISASRTPSDLNSGVAATIILTASKPGSATINLNSAIIRDPASNVIPVTFLPYQFQIQ